MTSGGNNFNDFPQNQLNKTTEKMTNQFFHNRHSLVYKQAAKTATEQSLLAEVTNTVARDWVCVATQIGVKKYHWRRPRAIIGYALCIITASFIIILTRDVTNQMFRLFCKL